MSVCEVYAVCGCVRVVCVDVCVLRKKTYKVLFPPITMKNAVPLALTAPPEACPYRWALIPMKWDHNVTVSYR